MTDPTAAVCGHICNVCCASGRHVDLVYAEAAATDTDVARAFQDRYPVLVRAVEPAAEAPNDAAAERMGLRLDRDALTPSGAVRPSCDRRLLVSWEALPSWSEAIRALLAATGETQPALASRLGISLSVLEKWLAGNRTPKGLYRRALVEALSAHGIERPG